jgi:hypothetical protein
MMMRRRKDMEAREMVGADLSQSLRLLLEESQRSLKDSLKMRKECLMMRIEAIMEEATRKKQKVALLED